MLAMNDDNEILNVTRVIIKPKNGSVWLLRQKKQWRSLSKSVRQIVLYMRLTSAIRAMRVKAYEYVD